MRHRTRHSPPGELRIPRQVCILHCDGTRLYALPHTWQAMYDFLKGKDAFVLSAEERAIHTMPGAEKFQEKVWVKPGAHQGTISVGNAHWGINDLSLQPQSSVRIVVTPTGPRAFRY
jgi:hypothetical protein